MSIISFCWKLAPLYKSDKELHHCKSDNFKRKQPATQVQPESHGQGQTPSNISYFSAAETSHL